MITKPIEDLRPEDFQDESLFIKPATHKKCMTCKQRKLVEYFYKNSSNSDGLDKSCKVCKNLINKKSHKKSKLKKQIESEMNLI